MAKSARTGPVGNTVKGARPGVGASHSCTAALPGGFSTNQLIVRSALTLTTRPGSSRADKAWDKGSCRPTKPGLTDIGQSVSML